MTDAPPEPDEIGLKPPPEIGPEEYNAALRAFDTAVCEAVAVGQAASGRMPAPHIGLGTLIFTRICGHAVAFVRTTPKSRWVNSHADVWDFSAVAGHARSIIEGYLLFAYLTKEPVSADQWSLKLNVMHLNDCTKRISVLGAAGRDDFVEFLHGQEKELREALRGNPEFLALPPKLQVELLTGRYLTIQNRDEQLAALGWDKVWYNALWDTLSQYTHVLPFSFYSMEPNGRGTGMLNDTDRGYITMFLRWCTELIEGCTEKMVDFFPNVALVRQGIDSKFYPGPRRNLPMHKK